MQLSNELDNPVWYSLQETHQNFAIDYGNIKFYNPDYCPFGGFRKDENLAVHISDYSTLSSNFFMVGEKPTFSDSLKLKKELICLQMAISQRVAVDINETMSNLMKRI